LARAVAELILTKGNGTRSVLDVLGDPVVALLIGVVVAMFTLGVQAGFPRAKISASVGGALGPIAGMLLIVAAGGGFKETLVEAGVGNVVASAANNSHLPVLVLGWLIAVGIRLATGSATVATITAAGFWLVKEYFGMSVGQTLASWSVMETIISVVGLAGVLVLNLIV